MSGPPVSSEEVAAIVAVLVLTAEGTEDRAPTRGDELAWRLSARSWHGRSRHDYPRS